MRADWTSKPLGDICNVVGGGTPSKRNPAFYEGDIPWATVRDMREEVLSRTEFNISPEAVKSSATNVIPSGNVVIATRVGLGKVCLLSQATAINQDLRGIIPKSNNLDVRFLFRWLQSVSHIIQAEGTGATVKGVKLPFVKSLSMPLPPLPEQKRIVAILDEAFAGIATAVANTEKNLANARELFKSYLNAVVSLGGEGWHRTKLGLEIDLQTGFAFKSKGYTKDVDGIRLLRGDNIIPGGIRWQDHKRWARGDAGAYRKYQLMAGDVVLAMDRTWIKSGLKYAQLNDADLPCLLVQRVARLRAGPRLNSDFLRCLIGSASFTNYVLSIQTGLGVPHISGPQISEFEFFMPPVDEQAAIALTLDDLGSSVGRLEANYKTKHAALCELKQSLLQKAFSGELTPGKEASDAIRKVEEVA